MARNRKPLRLRLPRAENQPDAQCCTRVIPPSATRASHAAASVWFSSWLPAARAPLVEHEQVLDAFTLRRETLAPIETIDSAIQRLMRLAKIRWHEVRVVQVRQRRALVGHSGECRDAFENRLLRTWTMRPGSAISRGRSSGRVDAQGVPASAAEEGASGVVHQADHKRRVFLRGRPCGPVVIPGMTEGRHPNHTPTWRNRGRSGLRFDDTHAAGCVAPVGGRALGLTGPAAAPCGSRRRAR